MPGPLQVGGSPQQLPPIQHTGAVAQHGPVGLGGQQVQVAPPGPPRNPILRGLTAIGQALSRAFTPSPPGPTRAQRAEQQATNKLESQVRGLIDQLGDPQRLARRDGTTAKAAELWTSLFKAERAETGLAQLGVDANGATARAIQGRLGELSDGDLRRLAQALQGDDVAQAQGGLSAHPDAERLLMQLQVAVNRELGDRVQATITEGTNKAVDQALASLDRGEVRGRIGAQMQAAFHPATRALDQLVTDKLSNLSAGDVSREVAQTIQSSLSRLPPDKVAALLKNTPTGELQRLALAGPGGAVAAAVAHEITDRTARLMSQVEDGTTRFLAHDPADAVNDPTGPLHDPVNFARSLNDLAEAIASLREHCKTHGLPFPPSADEMLARINDHGEELLRPGNLNLGELSHARLGNFAGTLKLLGIERANGPIQAESDRRLAPLETAYRQATQTMLTGLLNADPTAVLSGLRDMESSFTTLKKVRTEVKMDMNGAPEVARLRNTLTRQVLGGLSDDQAMRVFAALVKPENKALLEGLYVASDAAQAKHDEDLSLQLFAMSAFFEETLGQVMDDLTDTSVPGQRGISLPRNPDDNRLLSPSSNERPSLAHLNEAGRQAFRNVFSVEIGKQDAVMNRGGVDQAFLASMAAVQEMPPSDSEKSLVTLPGGLTVGEGFYKDAMRAFDYRLPNGDPLIDYTGWDQLSAPQRQTRVEAGFQRLIDFCGGNEDQARALSFLAHQSLAAGFRTACALNPDHNPLRLPDGRTGVVERGWPGHHEEIRTIGFSLGDDGRPVLSLDYTMRGGMLQTSNGERVWLDPALSRMSFSYRAELRDDGGLRIQGTPRYDFSLMASPFQRDYPPPTLADALNPLNTSLRDDVLAFADGEFSGETVRAQRGIDAFRAQPTLSRALDLVDQHVRAGSPQEVNSSPTTLLPILNTVDHAMTLAQPALVAAFGDALAMVDGLIQDNYYNGKQQTLSSLPNWPGGFAPPVDYQALLQSGNQPAIDAFHAHISHPTRAPEMVAFKQALADFGLNPSFDGAERLYTRFIAAGTPPPHGSQFTQVLPSVDTLNLDSSTRNQIRNLIDIVRDTPLAPTLFDPLDTELQNTLGQDILPRMTQAILNGNF